MASRYRERMELGLLVQILGVGQQEGAVVRKRKNPCRFHLAVTVLFRHQIDDGMKVVGVVTAA